MDEQPGSSTTFAKQPQRPNPILRGIRFVLRVIRNYFAFVGFVVTVLPILFAFAVSKGLKPEASVSIPKEATLALDLSGKVAERQPGFERVFMRRFFGGAKEIYLPELRAAFRRAAKDPRVIGVNVDVGGLSASPADYTELRRLLVDFRAAGKKVQAQISGAEDWSYYVASAADRVVMTPAGSVTLTGPTFHLIYFADALKKIGVDIDVVRAGKFKSAFEPFVENAPTAPTLEEYHAMQQSLMNHVVHEVAAGRGKPEGDVRAWYKRSIYTAEEALKLGIVDALDYEVAPPPKKDEEPITVMEYGAATIGAVAEPSSEGSDGIALIEAVGEINMARGSDIGDEDVITPDAIREEVRWAKENDNVKAVVLRVSSPGGSAVASDMIWHELEDLAQLKPLVVSMGAYAASGGYYISAPAKKIFAEPTTITGSIGVIGMLPNLAPFKDKYGVSFYVVTDSDRAAMLSMGQKPSTADKELVDQTIMEVYKTFVSKVSEGRDIPVEEVERLAQGRVYTGAEAKELRLVDEIGGMQAAFDAAKELAGFDKTKLYPVLHYEGKKMNLRDCLKDPVKMMRCLEEGDSRIMPELPGVMAADATRVAQRLEHWAKPQGRDRVLALWPAYLSLRWQ